MPRSFEAVYVAGVRVIENTYRPEQFDRYGKEKAIWVDASKENITVTADDARKLATALVEAADAWDKDYAEYEESLKPKLPTKKNAMVRYEHTVPFIYRNGYWRSPYSTVVTAEQLIEQHGSDFIVLFEGEDD